MKVTGLIFLVAAIIFLLSKLGRRKGPSRYDRKPSTPWNSLSEGEDPTL